jgi:hypothetical protein
MPESDLDGHDFDGHGHGGALSVHTGPGMGGRVDSLPAAE